MPSLNFKARFAPLIESGAKRRTIRAPRKDGRDPKKGDPLYLYTGMRTKNCRKLKAVKCLSVREILIADDGVINADLTDLNKFAQLDGFADWPEMRDWFDKTHGLPFNGVLIEW